MSKQDKRNVFISLGIAILIIVVIFLFQESIFGANSKGKIMIDRLEGPATVFVNSREEKRISGIRENFSLGRFDTGTQSVLISREGYWPWLKEVNVEAGSETTLSPFFIISNPTGFVVTNADPEYETLVGQIESVKLPTFDNKKVSADESVAIWVDGSTLFAEWLLSEEERPKYFCNEFGCHNVIVPLGVGGNIRNAEFYKNRSDVFMIAFGNGIFALEADTRGNQNFQPIFEGHAPQFILGPDENSIYIFDNNALRQIAI